MNKRLAAASLAGLSLMVRCAPAPAAGAEKSEEARAVKGEPQAAGESPAKPQATCVAEAKAYGQAGKELAALDPAQFGGDKDLYSKAKDGATRTRDLAANDVVRCARRTAKAAGVCAREFTALGRAETAYNDPGLMDADGALLRRAVRTAENLEACFAANEIAIPKHFVVKDRYRWTQAPSEEVVK